MCQATVFLDGEEIMRDVIYIEPLPEGVRLATFFEDPILVSASIQQIDLMKNRVILKSLVEQEENHEAK